MANNAPYMTGSQVLTTLAGTERIFLDNGGSLTAVAPVQIIDSFNTIGQQNYQLNSAATASFSATVANIIGGVGGSDHVTFQCSGALAGAGPNNVTTPTAAQLVAGFVGNSGVNAAQVGQTWILRLINSSSANYSWTLVGGTNVTVSGTTVTALQNAWREFLFTITALGTTPTITVQSIGTGTWS